jgi:MIP family channel proteins
MTLKERLEETKDPREGDLLLRATKHPTETDDNRTKFKTAVSPRHRSQGPDLNLIFIQRFRTQNVSVRNFLAEFYGTFMLILLGNGLVAQSTLSSNQNGNFITGAFGWGFTVTLSVLVSAPVSGGHLNPSFTLAFAILGKLPWSQVPVYMAGQYLGSFMASAVLFATYYEAFNAYDVACNVTRVVVGPCATAQVFSTYPQPYLSTFGGFVDQIVGTAILATLVVGITDDRGAKVPANLRAYFIGTVVAMVIAAYSLNCAAALNPARDLSPRIFTAIAGWGLEVFSFRNWLWFLVPIAGPHLGAVIGAIFYILCIGGHYPAEQN